MKKERIQTRISFLLDKYKQMKILRGNLCHTQNVSFQNTKFGTHIAIQYFSLFNNQTSWAL